MDYSTDPRLTVHGAVGSTGSDPARLCCALTQLSQALATYVPRTEMRIDYLRGVCDCRAFRTEEIGWRSGDGAS
jgi:acyl-coenzyme A thioesterase PaaI-like protein